MAQANRAAMDVLDADISGLLSLSLSQQGSGTLGTLRDLLGEIIEERLQIVYDVAPHGEIARHREAVHDLFLPLPADVADATARSSSSVLVVQRRRALSCLFNGDLEEPAIVHHCGFGCCRSAEQTLARFRALGTWALLPHKCPRLARHRWTGHAPAVEWAGLLASHHRLLQALLARWHVRQAPARMPLVAADDLEAAAFLDDDAGLGGGILGDAVPEHDAFVQPDTEEEGAASRQKL